MSYGGDDHRARFMMIMVWTCTGLEIVLVGMRLFVRRVVNKVSFEVHDSFVLLALLCNLSWATVFSVAVGLGYGTHTWLVPLNDRIPAGRYTLAATALSVITFPIPKFAVVALMTQIFETPKRLRVTFWALATLLLVACLSIFVCWYVQCTPIPHQWDPDIPGSCWDLDVLPVTGYCVGSFSAFLDVFFTAYPYFKITNLKMVRNKKWKPCILFGGGFIAAGCAIFKLTTVHVLISASKKDPLWASAPLLFWTRIEVFALMISTVLPTFGPYFVYIDKKLKTAWQVCKNCLVIFRKPSTVPRARETSPVVAVSSDDSALKSMEPGSMNTGPKKTSSDDDDIRLLDLPVASSISSRLQTGTDRILKTTDTNIGYEDASSHPSSLTATMPGWQAPPSQRRSSTFHPTSGT